MRQKNLKKFKKMYKNVKYETKHIVTYVMNENQKSNTQYFW
jgi:hypothetical protein